MTREEYNNLTDEQRYSYILELEEEKKVSDKALEKVLSYYKKNDNEFIQLTQVYDSSYQTELILRISDILRAQETVENKTIITTKEIEVGRNKRYTVKGTIDEIMMKINLVKDRSRNNIS